MNLNSDINPKELEFLDELEKLIRKPLSQVNEVGLQIVGIKIKDNSVVGLGLFSCNLENLPDTISNLNSLKELY